MRLSNKQMFNSSKLQKMFRKTIKYVAIIFAVAVSLVSCQKEDEIQQKNAKSAQKGVVELIVEQPILHKKSYVTKTDWIWYNYIAPDYTEPIGWVYTIKIHNDDWTVAQEWTVEDKYLGRDIAEDGFNGIYALGFGTALDFANNIVNLNGTNAGFRIPTGFDYNSDLTKLKNTLGSFAAIRDFLNLTYPEFGDSPHYYSNLEDDATMYLDTRYYEFPHIYGSMLCFDNPDEQPDYDMFNGSSYYHSPNYYRCQSRVRCVRNITPAQW